LNHGVTPITHLVVPALLTAALVGSSLPRADAAATATARHPEIDTTRQHVAIHTENVAGQPIDPTFFGRWQGLEPTTTVLVLKGASNRAETTTFDADSPAPNLVRPGAHGYCLVQEYRLTVGDVQSLARATYTSTVVVHRHGKVVLRDQLTGDYLSGASTGNVTSGYTYGPVTSHRQVRFAHFTWRRHDHVVWRFAGQLTNQINRFASFQRLRPTC
jgi:hypothetical protein